MDMKTIEESKTQQLILQEVEKLPHIADNQEKIFLKKGEDPLNTLDTNKYFYFVMSGKLKIYQIDFQTSKELTLYLLSRGDMFDVVSLLDGSPNQYISEVLEDTQVIRIPIEDVKGMILEDPAFRQLFYSYLATRLRAMENLAVSLSFYDVYQVCLRRNGL